LRWLRKCARLELASISPVNGSMAMIRATAR
jgi:hypothetical protein